MFSLRALSWLSLRAMDTSFLPPKNKCHSRTPLSLNPTSIVFQLETSSWALHGDLSHFDLAFCQGRTGSRRGAWKLACPRACAMISLCVSSRRSLARTAQADWTQAAVARAGFVCRSCFSSRAAAGAAASSLRLMKPRLECGATWIGSLVRLQVAPPLAQTPSCMRRHLSLPPRRLAYVPLWIRPQSIWYRMLFLSLKKLSFARRSVTWTIIRHGDHGTCKFQSHAAFANCARARGDDSSLHADCNLCDTVLVTQVPWTVTWQWRDASRLVCTTEAINTYILKCLDTLSPLPRRFARYACNLHPDTRHGATGFSTVSTAHTLTGLL